MSFFQPRTASTNGVSKVDKTAEAKPWVEKYRPRTINDIASQEQVVKVLNRALQSEDLPHLLFYGPPGTGKTSTILALARELYGPTLMKSRIIELNASDERGIQVVREKIKNFSRSTITSTVSGYPCPSYKIVILDEADSMTKDAQSALRRTMETYSKTTRFCLICNYVSRIIEPITSRCAKFRFKPLPSEDLRTRLDTICTQEKVVLAPKTMDALIKISQGDLRRATTFLQSGASLHRDKPITVETIHEMAGVIPDPTIDLLVASWQTVDYEKTEQLVNTLINAGYSAELVVAQLHEAMTMNDQFSTLQKAHIAQLFATADFRLVQGADEHLQMLDLLLKVSKIAVQ